MKIFIQNITQKTHIMGVAILLSLAIILVLFTTCDIGLGQIVNTEKPVINSAGDNPPGTFLQGTDNKIALDVSNKLGFKIVEVWMDVDYTDKDGFPATKRVDAQQDPETGEWFVNLDTSDMADGKISGKVTAKDESGNTTTTTEMIYNVKNMLPQIKLNIPSVSDINFDRPEFLNDIKNNDQVYQGLDIMGLATDDSGIYVVKDKDGKIIDEWPKIMIWPSNLDETKLNPDKTPIDNKEDNPYGQWRTVVMPKNHSSSATKFSWPLAQMIRDANAPDGTGWRLPETEAEFLFLDPGKQYRFRLWIKDSFGNDNYYPDRYDNTRGPGGTPADTEDYVKYIEITHQAIGDKPFVTVPEPPRYYNRVGDFVVDFTISSGESFEYDDPTAIKAWITTQNDGLGDILGRNYTIVYQPKEGIQKSPFRYKLTFTQEEAALWGAKEDIAGTLYVAIQGKNNQDQTGPTEYQYFNLDETPPTLVIDQPGILNVLNNNFKGTFKGGEYSILYPPVDSKPKWVTATVTVGGKANDNFIVDKIYFHVGMLSDDKGNKLNDDKMTDAQRVALYNSDIWTDTGLGTATMAPKWSGSVYAWNYIDTYPIGYKSDSKYKDLVQELSEVGFVPNSNFEGNYVTAGRERFYLPLYVKVVDIAGNINVVHYKLSIDPLLDEPQITFIYPKIGDTVGGTVRVTGTAEDNYWMHTVLMRIHKDKTSGNNYWYIPNTTPETKPFFTIPSSYPAEATPSDTAGWFELSLVGDGPVVNWTATVNGDGGLNPAESGADTVDVTFEVVAIDTADVAHLNPHIIGPIESRTVKFSSKVPRIEDIKVEKNGESREYVEGISSSGLFTVSMKISATEGINNVSARVNNDSQITLMADNTFINDPTKVDPSVWNITKPIKNGERYEATLTMTVNSTAANSIVSGIGYGKTGVMSLEITVEDSTAQHFSATNTFRVGIDNFYPSATIETSTMAYDDINAKKYFLVQGTAKDWGDGSGALQELERVLVYFEKARITYTNTTTWTGRKVEGNGSYLSPSGAAISAATNDTTYFIDYPNVMDTTYNYTPNQTTPNRPTYKIPKLIYDNTGKKWTSPTALVIDYAENDPTQDFDGDGTYGEKWVGLTDKIWEARMMISNRTTGNQQFPDGPYMVHYIVMDKAGNATHYQKDIYIENNRPLITHINIGTDINFDGKVDKWSETDGVIDPGEYRNNAFIINNTSEGQGSIEVSDDIFRIRNYRFGIELTQEKGNGMKTAQVTYVTKGAAIPVTGMERGHVYQIAKTAPNTDFTKYGAPNNYTSTVFVAAAKGEGDGEVYPFIRVNDQSLQLSDSKDSSRIANDYTNFGEKGASDEITDTKEGLFIMKVYDSTVTGTNVHPEYDQLAQAVLLTVSINNIDTDPPKIDISNFGRRHITSLTGNAKKYEDNVLSDLANAVYTDYINTTVTTVGSTTITTKNGYVQYQAHSPGYNSSTDTGTAYISGKVIFNGKVNDNHRIERITVEIPGYYNDNEFNIAVRNTNSGLLQPANTITGEREFGLMYTQAQVPQYSLEYGHTLVWKFMWDSSKITDIAKNNVGITFRVYDQNTATPSAIKRVNIVPYISEIETPLGKAYASSPSAFNRSAMGGYPVKEGDSITIKGFNLGDAVDIDNAVISGTDNVALSGVSNNGTTIKGTIPNNATSGPLVVTVNGIASFNNSANKSKTAAYNKEPNGVNNNVLDNSRYIYVWNTGYIDNSTVANIYNPFMRIAANGTRLLSYGWYPQSGQGVLRVRRNNTDIATATANTNRMTNTTIAISSAANGAAVNNSWYAIGSDITAGNYPFRFAKSTPAGTGYQDTNNLIAAIGANSNRFKIPRIAVQSTSTGTDNRSDANSDRILISYFDDDNKRIEVIYGNVGNNANISNIPGTAIQLATDSTTHKGSIYTAAGFLSNGLPLVTWYDRVNDNLVLSWGNSTPTTKDYNSATSRVFTPTGGSSVTTTASAQERIYTLAGHGLVATGTANNTANYDGFIVADGAVVNTRYYVRRVSGDDFVLNSANNINYGLPDLPETITFYPYSTVGRNANLATGGGVAGATVAVSVNFTIGERVVVTVNNGTPTLLTVSGIGGNSATTYTVTFASSLGANNVNSNTVRFFRAGKTPTSSRVERYYTAAAHGFTEGQTVQVSGASYSVYEINGNNFKLKDSSGNVADLTGNINITSQGWQDNAVIIDSGKGAHVDMAVDGDDNVHLAYYDVNNGGLYYALIHPTGTGADMRPNITKAGNMAANITPVKVDTFLSAGTKLMINVRKEGVNYVPYITYAHASFAETKNSIRVAWRADMTTTNVPAGTDANDIFTGKWEVMTVPVSSTVTPRTDEFVCNGVPTVTTWTAPGGTLNYNTNLNQTIIVGYMTDQWYEGAILKGNIITVPPALQK